MLRGSDNRIIYRKGCHVHTWTEIPLENAGHEWREGMVSGNGENGYVTSGAPYSDTFIFQYMWNNFPSPDPRVIPDELPSQLEEARWNVFHRNDEWIITDKDGKPRRRTFYYRYHPAHQLRLELSPRGHLSDYVRWTNYETAETGVRYTDEHGEWQRTSFTSRVDNVSITRITASSTGSRIQMIISIDDIVSMSGGATTPGVSEMQYKKLVGPDGDHIALVAHYPSYPGSELANGGYAGLTRIIAVGGSKRIIRLKESQDPMNVGAVHNPAVRITDAEEVILITQAARTFDMGRLEDFRQTSGYAILDQLAGHTREVAERYRDEDGRFDYEAALQAHAIVHAAEFGAVRFALGEGSDDTSMDNLTLLQAQKAEPTRVHPAFIRKVYEQARYAFICCSGSSAPRLYGMWTGEWNPGWRSIYTLDANVNLQVAAMNTGHMTFAQPGYINFILRNVPDFAHNARMAYGMHDALQVSVNSDGDRAMHVEYDNDYPFEYWNAGASWCLLPIFEYWQCYGNQRIPIHENMRIHDLQPYLGVQDGGLSDAEYRELLERGYLDLERDILLPLLTKQANFWEQICTPEYYTDVEGHARHEPGKKQLNPGERYIILPAYSPENHPAGCRSKLTANATMDIAAARDGLAMVIAMEQAVKREGYEAAVARWEALLQQLPRYLRDDDGALREWAMKEYRENNDHRHLSHLYPAWPAYEAHEDAELAAACRKALENRNRFNTGDNTAGHGWIHKALVAARLKDGDEAMSCLLPMMVSEGFYSSLMTDHDTNRRMRSYCTDTLFGIAAVVNEALVYSHTGVIELLPALPSYWRVGMICGLMARTRVEIRELRWNLEQGLVEATLRSIAPRPQTVRLELAVPWQAARKNGEAVGRTRQESRGVLWLELEPGVDVRVEFGL